MPPKLPIYYLRFSTQHLLCSTFLRFQEHYESPEFKGKIFTLEEFMDWYAKERGLFSYYSDWAGFNVPSEVLLPFRDGYFDPLTKKEARLLELTGRIEGRFYLIADEVSSKSVINHEFVHGLFGLNPEYANEVSAAISQHATNRFRRKLEKIGYHKDVLDDEINAYVLTGLVDELTGLDVTALKSALVKIFITRYGFNPGTASSAQKILSMIHEITF